MMGIEVTYICDGCGETPPKHIESSLQATLWPPPNWREVEITTEGLASLSSKAGFVRVILCEHCAHHLAKTIDPRDWQTVVKENT